MCCKQVLPSVSFNVPLSLMTSNSALFTLYDYSILHQQNETEKTRILGMLEEASMAIVAFSAYLFGRVETTNSGTFSPFVPYSLYQAGIVQFRLWKQTSALHHRESLDSIKKILGVFNIRWLTGGMMMRLDREFSLVRSADNCCRKVSGSIGDHESGLAFDSASRARILCACEWNVR